MFGVGLYALSEGLMNQASGAADPWHPEEVAEVVAYLRKRLDAWKPSGCATSAVWDAAVALTVRASLDSYQRWSPPRASLKDVRRQWDHLMGTVAKQRP